MAFTNASSNNTRLPTPPRDDQDNFDVHKAVDDALEYLEASLSSPHEQDSQQAGNAEPTRPTTPPPSSPIPNKSTSSTRSDEHPKVLRFSAETSFCESTAKPLLPSRLQHPAKSILKPFDMHASSSPTAAQSVSPQSGDIARMLEFALKALAGQDILSKRDAWSSLWTSLKAHQDFPSHESLRNSLPVLESFLRRDITQSSNIHEPSERQLKLQALQFAYLLLWKFPVIQDSTNSPGVSNDFAAFLIDHSIEAIGSDSVSKDLLRNYLGVLSAPEIHGQIFTADRSTKCVKALDFIPERLTGKSVFQLRISIFAQITSNHPNVAVETFDHIFPHLMSGLCSDFSPTRSRAIESALTIATCVGQRSHVAKTVREWLQRQDSDNVSYFTRFEQTLQGLLSAHDRHASQEEAHHAPQIWGILNMLARGDQMFLFHCLMRSSWTRIVATCFNATDSGLNLHAWTAWNRTIFAAQRLLLMRTRLLKKLCYPVFCCLQRANTDEERLRVKRQVHQSLRLILYYTYTHPLPADWMKAVWDIVIRGFCRHIRKDEVDDLFRFAQTLCSLFSDSTVKFRNAQRALSVDKEPLDSTEVPKLSPSWIRSNVDLILSTLGPLLCQHNPPQHYVLFVKPVWTSLMKAIAQAGEKEIKASEALRNAIAHTLNFFRNFWSVAKNHNEEQTNSTSMPVATLTALLKISVDVIGPLHWGEDVLVQTSEGHWEAANSPTRQAPSDFTARRLRSPIASVFSLLSNPTPDVKPTPNFRGDVSKILQSCLILRPSVSSRLDLLISCCKSLPLILNLEQRQTVPILWQSLMEQTLPDIVNVTEIDCRKILRLLSFGLRLPDKKSFDIGRAVLNKLVTLYRRDHQDRVFVTSIAQPWMEFLFKDRMCNGNTLLKYQALLIESYPPIAHTTGFVVDRDLRHWNNSLFQHDHIRWPDMLYKTIGATLTECYSNPSAFDLNAVYDFLSTVRDFLGQADRLWLATVWDGLYPLHHFHSGLLLWIRDNAKLALRFEDRGYNLREPIKDILESMFKLLVAHVPSHHSRLPVEFEALFLGAFQSQSKDIANVAIIAWNAMSEHCGSIEYSQDLACTLERLTEFTDVHIPSTHSITERENMDVDSPREISDLFPWIKDATIENEVTPLRRRKTAKVQSYSPLNRLRGLVNSTPSKSLVHYQSPTPTKTHPRLRHDDSQVQFLPIVSSSPSNVGVVESQYLTEHQKDVRTRQLEDAAMFPNLGSSPTPSRPKNLADKQSSDESTPAAIRSPGDPEQREGQSDSQHAPGTDSSLHQDIQPRNTCSNVEQLDESAECEPNISEEQLEFTRADDKENRIVQAVGSTRSTSGAEVFVDASSSVVVQDNSEERPENVNQEDNGELRAPRSSGGPLKDISPNTSHVRSTHGTDIDKGNSPNDLVERIEDSFLPNKSSGSVQAISCSKPSDSEQSLKDTSDSNLLQASVQPRIFNEGSSPLAAKSIQSQPLHQSKDSSVHEDILTSEKDLNTEVLDDSNVDSSQANSQTDSVSSSQEMPALSLLFPKRRSDRRRTSTPNYNVTRRNAKRQPSSSFEKATFTPRSFPNSDEDASDEIITVEPPDADSPSLRTVLQQLGIIGADGRVSSARSSPSGSQLEASKRKRSDSAESSQIRQEDPREGELSAKRRRMGGLASSQLEEVVDSQRGLVSASVLSEGNEDADGLIVKTEGAMSVISRLKGLIGEVRELQFSSSDDATKEELVELGKQLQAEVKAVTGL